MTDYPAHPMPRLRTCAWLFGMLLLGGCVQATRSVAIRHYDLGATTSVAALDSQPGRTGKVLRIATFSTVPWLAGTAMHYRLRYQHDQRLAAYAHSDWIAPPADLLAPLLRSAIVAGGAWRAVIGPRDAAQADASVHVRLDDFSQVFPEPGHSAGVIDATVTLLDERDDHVTAQRHFHIEVAAPTADAAGGAKALGEASRELGARLQRWLH